MILDVTDQTDIDRNKLIVNEKFGYLDTLINNAGIALDNHEDAATLSTNVIRKEFDVNFFGTVSMIQAFIPLLKRAKSGKLLMYPAIWALSTWLRTQIRNFTMSVP